MPPTAVVNLELETERLGQSEPRQRGTVAGAAHRTWIDLKPKLGAGDKSILDSVEQGEDSAKKAYEHALAENLPEDVKTLVLGQAEAVRAAHDRVKLFRDARRAA